MNMFKLLFSESKDQAVPYALPALKSYKQSLLFVNGKVLNDQEEKEKTVEKRSSPNRSVKTPLRLVQTNKALGRTQGSGSRKPKTQMLNETYKSLKSKLLKNEKLTNSPKLPNKSLKEDLENTENPSILQKHAKPKTASSLRPALLQNREKTPNFSMRRKKSPTVSEQSLIPLPKSSQDLNVNCRPSDAVQEHIPKARTLATRSLSRKRPKISRQVNVFPISFRISDLSIAPLY